MGVWVRKLAITGSAKQFAFCLGTSSAANSAYIYLGETAFGFLIGCEVLNSAGTSWINSAAAGTPVQDGNDYLIVLQRRSGNLEAYHILEGSTVSATTLNAAGISGTFNASTIKLGYDPGAQLKNPLGEFFLFTDRSLSFAQLTTLAAGARPKTSNVGGEPLILLPFRSGDVASETNLGTGGATYDSTRVSSGFTTTTDFFTLPTTPAITGVSTMTPRQGESFTITGTNFGAAQGSGYVSLGGVTQYKTTSWSNTSITIVVDRGTQKYGVGINVVVVDSSLNPSNNYALTSLLPQTGWDYVDIGTPNTTASFRITSTADLASGDQVAYDTLGSTVTVFSDGTFSVSGSPYYFNAEVWTSPDGWGQTTPQVLIAGPRSRSMLGNPIGAGPTGTFLLGSVGLGSVVTQAGVSGASSQAAGGVVLIVAGSSRNRGEVDAKVAIGARGAAQSQGPAVASVAQIIGLAGVASSPQQAEGRVGLAVVGAAQSTAPAVGGTVVAAVAAGAAGSSSQAAGQVVLAVFGNAQSISQIVAPVSVLTAGQTHGLGAAAASQALAAQGAAGAASQAAGVSSSAAVGATSGEGAGASQAAGQVAIAVVGVSSGGGAAAGARAQIVAVGGESFVVSGGVSNVAVAARGEGHGLAPATAAFVSSAVIAGVAQSPSTAQGIGIDGNAPVPDGDTYCGFIVNVGRLMHR